MTKSKNIVLTGFWHPTNEMLRIFSAHPTTNPDGWQGANWRGLGYDIFSFFPEAEAGNRGTGAGNFRVDFASVYNDFIHVTEAFLPIAILGFGFAPYANLRFETNYPAKFQKWFESGEIPSVVGEKICYPIADSLKTSKTFYSSLPVKKIKSKVDSLMLSNFQTEINDPGDPGEYLCAFLSYLLGWHHAEHPETNQMAGFIHAQGQISDLKQALEVTLREVISKII